MWLNGVDLSNNHFEFCKQMCRKVEIVWILYGVLRWSLIGSYYVRLKTYHCEIIRKAWLWFVLCSFHWLVNKMKQGSAQNLDKKKHNYASDVKMFLGSQRKLWISASALFTHVGSKVFNKYTHLKSGCGVMVGISPSRTPLSLMLSLPLGSSNAFSLSRTDGLRFKENKNVRN